METTAAASRSKPFDFFGLLHFRPLSLELVNELELHASIVYFYKGEFEQQQEKGNPFFPHVPPTLFALATAATASLSCGPTASPSIFVSLGSRRSISSRYSRLAPRSRYSVASGLPASKRWVSAVSDDRRSTSAQDVILLFEARSTRSFGSFSAPA